MTNTDSDGDDLVTGAVAPSKEEPEAPIARKAGFQPWHRPRKHFVRINQWCALARDLVRRRKAQFKHRPLHYLSLPGDELLDVRALHGAIARHEVTLRYLGFNSGRSTETSLSVTEVNNLERIDRSSFVAKDRFELIGNERSLAHRQARDLAPFDIVNLDLCASAAAVPPTSGATIFRALKTVLELQGQTQGGEWLLFLTTRADVGTADPEAVGALMSCVTGNATNHVAFGESLSKVLGISATNLSDPMALGARDFAVAFGLGVGKWLLKMANGAGNAWEVELCGESYWYRVQAAIPDMLSLAFRFTRQQTVYDGSGLSGPSVQPSVRSELDLAIEMISKMNSIVDVDAYLEANPDKNAKVVQQSRELLEQARFDGDAYVNWVADQTGPQEGPRM